MTQVQARVVPYSGMDLIDDGIVIPYDTFQVLCPNGKVVSVTMALNITNEQLAFALEELARGVREAAKHGDRRLGHGHR